MVHESQGAHILGRNKVEIENTAALRETRRRRTI